eukprot:85805_1
MATDICARMQKSHILSMIYKIILVFWILIYTTYSGIAPIPGQFDSCNSLSSWTSDCTNILTTNDQSFCNSVTCIEISRPKCSIQRSFDSTNHYTTSLEYDIYINNFDGMDTAIVSVICGGTEKIAKEYTTSFIRGLYYETIDIVNLGCDDSIFIVKFTIDPDTSSHGGNQDSFIFIDNIVINSYQLLLTPSPTPPCSLSMNQCQLSNTGSQKYFCLQPNRIAWYKWDISTICQPVYPPDAYYIEGDTIESLSCCPPTTSPTNNPTNNPTYTTNIPTITPTPAPTINPTISPTNAPLYPPSNAPTNAPLY